MKTKFKAGYDYQITEHEVVKESDKMITYIYHWFNNKNERKEYKVSQYYDWFDSLEEAENHLKNKIKSKIIVLEKQIEQLKNTQIKFKPINNV